MLGRCKRWKAASERTVLVQLHSFSDHDQKCICCGKAPSRPIWFYGGTRTRFERLCNDCGSRVGVAWSTSYRRAPQGAESLQFSSLICPTALKSLTS